MWVARTNLNSHIHNAPSSEMAAHMEPLVKLTMECGLCGKTLEFSEPGHKRIPKSIQEAFRGTHRECAKKRARQELNARPAPPVRQPKARKYESPF